MDEAMLTGRVSSGVRAASSGWSPSLRPAPSVTPRPSGPDALHTGTDAAAPQPEQSRRRRALHAMGIAPAPTRSCSESLPSSSMEGVMFAI